MNHPRDEALIGVDRAAGLASLFGFVRVAWARVDPNPFVAGWHVEELCLHLSALSTLQIDRLAVSLPPGYSKSTICSVLWPVWHWLTIDPDHRVLASSVDPTIATRDGRRSRGLVRDPWFQARWGDLLRLSRPARGRQVEEDAGEGDHADSAKEWHVAVPEGNEGRFRRAGLRLSTSIGGSAIGFHANVQIGDDLIKQQNRTLADCLRAREYWRALSTRRVPGHPLRRLLLQQRLAKADMIDLARERGYEVLALPLEYDPDRVQLPRSDERSLPRTSIGGDRRTERGELLCEALAPPEGVEALRVEAGSEYDTQQQLDPRDPGAVTLATLGPPWRHLPPGPAIVTWSWDLRTAEREDPALSYVVGWCFKRIGTESYLVAERRAQWGFVASKAQIRAGALVLRGQCLIENRANGPAAEQDLKNSVPGLKLVDPKGGKEQRAIAAQPFLPHVHPPHPEVAPWIGDALRELEHFPRRPNDRGDALTQYVVHAYLDPRAKFSADLANLRR